MNPAKPQENKAKPVFRHRDVSHPSATVTQGVTHQDSDPPRRPVRSSTAARPRGSRRSPGPYLQKRAGIYYFRKRLSRRLASKCGCGFLCLSLRTRFPIEAMQRAARLLAALDDTEQNLMTDPATNHLDTAQIRALLTEALRTEIARLLKAQDRAGDRSDTEIDARIERLEAENKRLRRAAQRNDFRDAISWLEPASRTTSLPLPGALSPNLGREVLRAMRTLGEIAIKVEEGEDAVHESAPLVARYSQAPVREFVTRPILISVAIAETKKLYPESMHPSIEATGRLLKEFFGDVPIDLITKDRQKGFFTFVARLPKKHGTSHGNNRYVKDRKGPLKREEIEKADLEDAWVTEEIRALEGVSLHEKRAMLADRLTPRVTLANIYKHHSGFSRMLKGAAELGAGADIKKLTRKEIKQHLATQAPDDELYLRVTRPKKRTAWTEERLAKFLTSPLFTGCLSENRRWRPGKVILRDASYWVPLLVMFIGSRIEEILQLRRSGLRRRNGVLGLAIGGSPEQSIKNGDSERFVPIPQVLLELGFVDWIRSLPDDHGDLLFPDAAARSSTGVLSNAFGKHLRLILARLDLGSAEEDFYALRKTLLSALDRADVPNATRQAIAGHKNGDIINSHYTAENAPGIKRALDRADFGLVIEPSEAHGFPVIVDCKLAPDAIFETDVELGSDGLARRLRVTDGATGEDLLVARLSNLSPVAGETEGDVPVMHPRDAAARLNALEALGHLQRPAYPPKQAALEALQALA
jgi:hypothetical protein